MIKRKDFISIIKLRSVWRIDRRVGNYKLPNGKMLSEYVKKLVESQMEVDSVVIDGDGDFSSYSGGTWSSKTKEFIPFNIFDYSDPEGELCSFDEMERRVKRLVCEIIGGKR